MNWFKETWIDIEDIIKLIVNEKEITNFLLDIQNWYRIERAMQEDEWDRLLTWTRVIDDIINRLQNLEQARAEYFEKKKQEEQEKLEEENK
jgi:hypothetical protein